MRSNFCFLNELTINSSLVQKNVHNFCENAANAESNYNKNIWNTLCYIREAAYCSCKIIQLQNQQKFEAEGLHDYVGRKNAFKKMLDADILLHLDFIDKNTIKAYRDDFDIAKQSMSHLFEISKYLYKLLGGKADIQSFSLLLKEEIPQDIKKEIPSVADLFAKIQRPVKEGIIKDGVDGGLGRMQEMQGTIDDVLKLLKHVDSNFIKEDEFHSALIKLEEGMKKQYEFGRADTSRQIREIETKFDSIQNSKGQNSITLEDLEAKLTLLLNQMDSVQAKQKNNMEYVAKIMDSTDKIMDNFVKLNEQNLTIVTEGTKYILSEIKKASSKCNDIIKNFTEEIKATEQKYRNSKINTYPQNEQMPNNFRNPVKSKTTQPRRHTNWQLPKVVSLCKLSETLQLTERNKYYARLYTLIVTLLAWWITFSYIGYTRDLTTSVFWKAGFISWYFITWSIALLAKVGFELNKRKENTEAKLKQFVLSLDEKSRENIICHYGYLHIKALIIDSKVMIIGSNNMLSNIPRKPKLNNFEPYTQGEVMMVTRDSMAIRAVERYCKGIKVSKLI